MTRRQKRRTQSPAVSSTSSRKLFVDYPYPIINELTNGHRRRRRSEHLNNLTSLQWCRDGFNRISNILHNIRNPASSTAFIEESLKQAHNNKHSSTTIANNLRKRIESIDYT